MGDIIIKPDELLNGIQVATPIFAITLAPGTYTRGMALGKVNGVHNLIGELNYDAATFNCILTEDITLEAEGEATAYFAGEFNKDVVTVKDGAVVDDIIDPARKLGIFIG